jgi:hypothetical protein
MLRITQGLSNKNSGDAHSSLMANPTAYNLKMKVPIPFHTSVTIYQPKECRIPENLNLHTQNYFVCCDFVPHPEYSILTHFLLPHYGLPSYIPILYIQNKFLVTHIYPEHLKLYSVKKGGIFTLLFTELP